MAPKIRNNKGQSLLEGLIWLPIFLISVSTLMTLLFWAWVSLWAKFHLYETLLCAATIDTKKAICISETKQALNRLIVIPAKVSLFIEGKNSLKATLKIEYSKIRWIYKDKLNVRSIN